MEHKDLGGDRRDPSPPPYWTKIVLISCGFFYGNFDKVLLVLPPLESRRPYGESWICPWVEHYKNEETSIQITLSQFTLVLERNFIAMFNRGQKTKNVENLSVDSFK